MFSFDSGEACIFSRILAREVTVGHSLSSLLNLRDLESVVMIDFMIFLFDLLS